MMISILTAAMLAQSLPAPGSAQWENVGAPSVGISFAFDPASIARTGDRVTFRMKASHPADEQGVTDAVMGFTMDCRARTATMNAVDFYKADGSFARSLPAAEFDDDPQPVSNQGPQHDIMTRVCAAPAAAAAH
jgi:hypothetical protein